MRIKFQFTGIFCYSIDFMSTSDFRVFIRMKYFFNSNFIFATLFKACLINPSFGPETETI